MVVVAGEFHKKCPQRPPSLLPWVMPQEDTIYFQRGIGGQMNETGAPAPSRTRWRVGLGGARFRASLTCAKRG